MRGPAHPAGHPQRSRGIQSFSLIVIDLPLSFVHHKLPFVGGCFEYLLQPAKLAQEYLHMQVTSKKMNKLIQFGENVEGHSIRVLNEREIRASAGILFLATFISLMFVVFKNDFMPIKYVITFFLADFIIRVLVNPKFSPTLIIGRLIVRNQVPEYVGAKQKKFAWIIGVTLSATMFIFMVVVNSYSPITGIICLICLVFLFFESAFGICLGCKFYSLFHKGKAQYCPGEICDAKSKQDIQKTSGVQLLIVFAFVASIFLAAWLFNDQFSKKPYELFGINGSAKSK